MGRVGSQSKFLIATENKSIGIRPNRRANTCHHSSRQIGIYSDGEVHYGSNGAAKHVLCDRPNYVMAFHHAS